MEKGTSLFYTFHEQGSPYIIAGIHSSTGFSEETLRRNMLKLLNRDGFHERESLTFVNHTHVYANRLLGNEIPKEIKRVLQDFFPESLDENFSSSMDFQFHFYDARANDFVWDNRYRTELKEYRRTLQKAAADEYQKKRKLAKEQR